MTQTSLRDLLLVLLLCAVWPPATFAAKPPAGPPGPPPVPEATVVVHCDAGGSLADALATRADLLTVEFDGTCAEELVITRDRLTLRGLDASATVTDDPATGGAVALLLLQGADVVLEGFTVDGSSDRGVRLQRASGVQMVDMTVTGNANSGLTIEEASSVHVIDSVFTGNVFAGVSAWGNSNLTLTGTLDVSSNSVAGLLVTGSTFMSRGGQLIVANDVFFGVGTQHGGSGLFPPVEASNNLAGVFTFGGTYLGPITVDGASIGLLVSNRGSFDGAVDVTALDEGVRILDNSNAFLRGGPVSAPLGINGFNLSTLETTGVSFDGDLFFDFGSHAFFAGTTAAGSVICHPTAVVGGSLSCASPVAGETESFAGPTRRHPPLPYPLPLDEPN
jgi:hypothetical protein